MSEPMSAEQLVEALNLAADTTDRVLADRVPKLVREIKRLQAHLHNAGRNETEQEKFLLAVEKVVYAALPDAVAEDGLAENVQKLGAEVDRLRAAVPSWADLRDLLAAQRYTAATDVEITNAVMALITGADHG